MKNTIELPIDDGKYTYIIRADGSSCALRYGKEWIDDLSGMPGGKMLMMMAFELEEARDLLAWKPIESAPKGEEIFLAKCDDGRIMLVKGSVLSSMRDRKTPHHLQFHAVAWKMP